MEKIPESDLILNKDGSIFHLSVKPEQVGDTIIAVGDSGLVHLISQHFDEISVEVNRREFNTHTGVFNKKKISVISTGIGADNIEIFYNEIDALVNIDFKKRTVKEKKKKLNIIRIGESASIQEDIKLGSFIVAEYGVGFDNIFNFYDLPLNEFEKSISSSIRNGLSFDFSPYCVKGSVLLRKKLQIEGLISGNTVSSAGFYGSQSRSLRLKARYPDLLSALTFVHQDDFWLTDIDTETAAHYAMARLLGHEVISINAVTIDRSKNKVAKNPHKIVDKLIASVLENL